MRRTITSLALLLAVGFGSVSALVGCSKKDGDPKPVNIKEDPRIKRSTEGGGGGKSTEGGEIK